MTTTPNIRAQFDALPTEKQAAILDKHRDCNVECYEWWDYEVEDFANRLNGVGICVSPRQVYFSGFWSQGDGACFEGYVTDWPLFLEKHGLLPKFQPFLDLIPKADTCRFRSTTRRGNNMITNIEWSCTNWAEEGSVRHTMVQALIDLCESLLIEFEDACGTVFQDHASQLYRDLEAEYDHLTSDEEVLDHLIANEVLEEEIDACTSDE